MQGKIGTFESNGTMKKSIKNGREMDSPSTELGSRLLFGIRGVLKPSSDAPIAYSNRALLRSNTV